VSRREHRKLQAQAREALAARRKPLVRKIEVLEQALGRANADVAAFETRLGDQGLYQPARKGELQKLLQDSQRQKAKQLQLEEEWLAAQEALEQLDAEAAAG
jgi:ATP-binding cassette subfamily F protein 3